MSSKNNTSKEFKKFLTNASHQEFDINSKFLKDRTTLVRHIKKYLKQNPKANFKSVIKKLFGKNDKQRIYAFPTNDVIQTIVNLVLKYKSQFVLELFAGLGIISKILSSELKKYQIQYIATDNLSYGFDKLFYPVKKMDYEKALEKYVKLKPFVTAFLPDKPLQNVPKIISFIKKNNLMFLYWMYNAHFHYIRKIITVNKLRMEKIFIPTLVYGDSLDPTKKWNVGDQINPPTTTLYLIYKQ